MDGGSPTYLSLWAHLNSTLLASFRFRFLFTFSQLWTTTPLLSCCLWGKFYRGGDSQSPRPVSFSRLLRHAENTLVLFFVICPTPYKRRKLWKTGEDGLCCSSSAIQTRLDPSSLLEEWSETPIVFVVSFVLSATPQTGGNGQGI